MALQEINGQHPNAKDPEKDTEKQSIASEAVEKPIEEGSRLNEDDFYEMLAGDGVPGGLPNQGFHDV